MRGGRSIRLSKPRRLVVDLLYFARSIPSLPVQKRMQLGAVVSARKLARKRVYWSASLKIREKHTLVTAGVYRLIRHPMYSSFLLLAFAQFLLLSNWFAGLAGTAGALALFAFRVEREEKMMTDLFGAEYSTYMTRTKRIIPWIY